MIYREAGAQPTCPECGLPLKRIAFSDRFRCNRCQGIWVDPETLRVIWDQLRPATPWPGTDAIGDGTLPCALCAKAMVRIVLDALTASLCRGHGIWLDRHEMSRVFMYESDRIFGDSQRLVKALRGE